MSLLFWRSNNDGKDVTTGDDFPLPVDVRKPIVQDLAIASGMEQITVAGTSIGLTTSKWTGSASCCLIYVETAPVRVRFDGTPATATVGILVNPGDSVPLMNPTEMGNFSAIRTTGTSAGLTVLYATSPTALAQRPPIVRGFSTDSAGNVNTNANTLTAGEDTTVGVVKVEERFGYTNIVLAAPTTTLVKSGAGFLHSVVINKGAAGTIELDDALTHTTPIIGTITGVVGTPVSLIYDIAFSTGLSITTSTAAQDITVCWR